MKKLLFGALITVLFNLTSCHFTEKVVIKEDGSGSFDFTFDMSDMMKKMDDMKGEEDENAEKEPNEIVDSVMTFAEVFELKKDSIDKLSAEDKKIIEQLKALDMKVKIHTNKNEKELWMSYLFDFKNINKLDDFQKIITDAQSIEKGKNNEIPSVTKTTYSFKGNEFKRIVTDKNLTEEQQAAYDAYFDQSAMFLEGSTYTIEYHFPRAVKSTTAKDVTFSDNKKILYLTKSFKEVLEKPELLNFTVILKK